ncbi:FAD-dependent oxidoreductase [Streptomyces canus]|uniref:FAD-dependent oxidoreductase n=1 Tax=Streptomyces canus TaxID=58343 RepID=UPI003814FE8B
MTPNSPGDNGGSTGPVTARPVRDARAPRDVRVRRDVRAGRAGADGPGATGEVAIVGCGPSGCYTALALRRLAPEVRITVFDGRPTPYGLVRYGIASDHQGMKGVSRQFDRLFASEGVEFVGNTVIGRDIPLTTLEQAFDVVVVATGLSEDQSLQVPTDPRARVYGAGRLLRFLNGDPDSQARSFGSSHGPLGTHLLMVGAGNVALDVARLLCKTEEAFTGTDIDDEARLSLATQDLRRLTLLARGPRERARWDASMFTELCRLPGVVITVDGEAEERGPSGGADVASDACPKDGTLPVRDAIHIDIHFNETPTAIEYGDGRTLVRTGRAGTATLSSELRESANQGERARADEAVYAVDLVVTAMGFVRPTVEQNPVAHADPERHVRAGGAHSGALGNLAENRTLAKAAAQQVADRLRRSSGRPGLDGIRDLLPADAVSFEDWKAIDRAEVARARPDRLRWKFTTREEMAGVVENYRGTTLPDPTDPVTQRATDVGVADGTTGAMHDDVSVADRQ